ncbi:MAG: hypothetical protein M3342_08620 [Bacteroidota bacterium]|nr:hypothetical protein [Bacteroidota bacterium]
MSNRKTITGTFFLTNIVLPYLFFVAFLVQQQYIRWSMKEALERSHLQTINIPANEAQWIKKGKEILIKGHLFDVERIQEENGQLSLQGLFDDAETALVKQLDNACREKNKNNSFAFASFFQLLSNCFYQWPEELPVAKSSIHPLYAHVSDSLLDGHKRMFFPPPQSL